MMVSQENVGNTRLHGFYGISLSRVLITFYDICCEMWVEIIDHWILHEFCIFACLPKLCCPVDTGPWKMTTRGGGLRRSMKMLTVWGWRPKTAPSKKVIADETCFSLLSINCLGEITFLGFHEFKWMFPKLTFTRLYPLNFIPFYSHHHRHN